MPASGEEALPEAPAGLRTNLAETAFFYPQLRTNEQGEVSFSFTMPESLTRWNFRGYAHTKGMLMGTLDGEAITSKEFMLTRICHVSCVWAIRPLLLPLSLT